MAGDDPVGPIASQHYDGRYPTLIHVVHCLYRVAGGLPDGHLKELQLRQRLLLGAGFVAAEGSVETAVEAAGGGHHEDFLDAQRPEAHHQAVDHVPLLGVVEDRRARDQPPDVAPGGGVGYYADGCGFSHALFLLREERLDQTVHLSSGLHLDHVSLAVDDLDLGVVWEIF